MRIGLSVPISLTVIISLAALCGARWQHSATTQEVADKATVKSPVSDAKPSILLYVIDTMRADELSCYGAKVTKTPAFDRFAAEGALFVNANSLAAATRPSMASLMTGVPGEVHGAQKGNQSLLMTSKELVRLPELLQAQGYYTAAIVANPNLAKVFGFSRGFDSFVEVFAPRENFQAHDEERGLISDAAEMVEKARHFIETAPTDKPFFLFVMSIDPHDPYTPPPPFETMYAPEAKGSRDGSLEAMNEIHTQIQNGKKPNMDRARALYRGEISFADSQFGKLMDWMRDSGRLDRTLVALTADHGEEFMDHGNRGHGKSVYEELTHIPMILRYPHAFKPGTRQEERVDSLDLSATLVAICGGARPAFWHGRDLRSALATRPIFSSQRRPPMNFKSVRLDGYKMIRDESKGKVECYYLPDDPSEQRPLSGADKEKAEKLLGPKLADFERVTRTLRQKVATGETELKESDLPPDVVRALKALGYIDDN